MKMVDMSGKKFGHLTAIRPIRKNKHSTYWLFKCDCGNDYIKNGWSVRRGIISSCSCNQYKVHIKHGMSLSPEYRIWSAARERCFNKNSISYRNYGARGIRMCDEWKNSFISFISSVGKRPGPEYSIDRINNNGNYEPGNCRWATRSQQNLNKRKKSEIIRG